LTGQLSCVKIEASASTTATWDGLFPTWQRRSSMDFEGYCVKCRAKRKVKNANVVKTGRGRPMAKGVCPVCGTTVTRFLSKEEEKKK
jgi:hypothetical protein